MLHWRIIASVRITNNRATSDAHSADLIDTVTHRVYHYRLDGVEQERLEEDLIVRVVSLNFLRHSLEVLVREGGLKRLIKFGLVGLSGVGVNFGLFFLLYRVAHLHDLAALVIATAASVVSNFILNDIWTFRDRRIARIRATLERGLKFGLVSTVPIAINLAVYTPLNRLIDVYYLLAYAAAIAVGMIWNFTVNVLWTWRRQPEKPLDL